MSLHPLRRCAGAASSFLFAIHAVAQCDPVPQPGIGVPAPQGYVQAMTSWDPDGPGPLPTGLVAAGQLTFESSLRAAIGIWNGTEWQPLGSPPGDRATAVIVFQGRLVAAFPGLVAAYDGVSWQTLGTLSGGFVSVRAFALFQGNLVVGGNFTSVNGVVVNNVAQWTGAAWGALGTGVSGEVRALAVHTIQPTLGTGLYVGGSLTAAGGTTVHGLASWDGATWRMVARMHGDVHCMAVRIGTSAANSYLFVGGNFGYVGQVPALLTTPSVARYQPGTDTWTAMGTTFQNRTVRSLFVRGTGINSFEVVAGATQTNLIAHRWNGTTWTSMGTPTANGETAMSIAYYNGQYAAGTDVGASRFDGTSWAPIAPATPGFAGRVTALLDDGADMIAGGTQLSVAGVAMHGVMRGSGATWSPMAGGVAGPNGTVHALARLTNGDVVAAGDFTVAGGGAGDRIARWNGSTWSPLGGGADGTVRTLLALPDGSLLAGGNFQNIGGAPAAFVARWTGSAWVPLGLGTNAAVHDLALLPNGHVVAVGLFTLAGSLVNVVNHVARFDGSNWHALGGGTNGPVDDVAVAPNGDIVVSGSFTLAGGQPANSSARWNGTWTAPYQGLGTQMPGLVIRPDGDLLFRYPGQVVRWNGVGSLALVALAVQGSIDCLHQAPNGDVLVGGDFLGIGTVVAHGVTRVTAPCAALAAPYGAGCNSSVGPVVTTALQLPWLGGAYRARTTGIAPTGVAFDLLGFQPAAVPLGAVHPSGAGCSVLVANPVSQLLLPQNGAVTSQLAFPNNAAFLGATLRNQVVQLELGLGGLTGISSGNGLLLTVGRL